MLRKLIALLCLIVLVDCASVRQQSSSAEEGDNDDNVYAKEQYHPSSRSFQSYSSNGPALHGPWEKTDWNGVAKRELETARDITEKIQRNKAKNVIFFIGDGMGLSTIASARLYHAETRNLKGDKIYLAWERLPHVALSRTYNVDRSTPDSAGTATAYLCGVKANYETIGVNENVPFDNCAAVADNKVRSIAKESIAAGKWTGIVTTTRVTHASPAGAYANVANRDWEASVPSTVPEHDKCSDIALQLITDKENQKTRVILGGGSVMFLPNSSSGEREDDRNLIEEWIKMRKDNQESHKFVQNLTEFEAVNPNNVDYLMGLFSSWDMDYEVDRIKKKPLQQPSLAEMTKKAIEILQRGPNGYFLFVEGGRIDHAHHAGNAFRALNDTVALSDAVQTAINMTKSDDTLIVVTADHSHVFTFGGYASFNISVLDLSDGTTTNDTKPFLQLNYANGPGYPDHRQINHTEVPRKDLTGVDVKDPEFRQDTGIFMDSETHGGEDVGIYASGPMSHLFHGNHEQNYIAHVIMYASCVGDYKGEAHCSASAANHLEKSSMLLLPTLLHAVLYVVRYATIN